MATYLVVGSGPVGTSASQLLLDQAHEVRLVTRRGTGPEARGLARVAADASNAETVTRLATGCVAILNCANPAYHRWPTDWPPIAASLLRAAENSGAVLATMANLYVYGRVTGPMTPDNPMSATYEKAIVRATMWRDALAAHEAGRLRATEVRASDFVGPTTHGAIDERVLDRLTSGKRCRVLGSPDQPHSWTYTLDAARTLVASAQDHRAWGRAWHAPTNEPRTQRDLIGEFCDAAGVPRVPVAAYPSPLLVTLGLFSPLVRELRHTRYQFDEPFVIDDAATRRELELEPTPWDNVIKATLATHA